jgi:hypothetical protein
MKKHAFEERRTALRDPSAYKLLIGGRPSGIYTILASNREATTRCQAPTAEQTWILL